MTLLLEIVLSVFVGVAAGAFLIRFLKNEPEEELGSVSRGWLRDHKRRNPEG